MIGASNSWSKDAGVGGDVGGDRSWATGWTAGARDDAVIWIGNYPCDSSRWLNCSSDTGDGGG